MNESVKCLDYRRLGKQRVEAMQILKALGNPSYGWQNHPAVKMWRGYEEALKFYMNMCILEWKSGDTITIWSCMTLTYLS